MIKRISFYTIAILAFLFSTLVVEAKGKADDAMFNNYMISGAGSSAASGSYLVRVSVTTKNPRLSDADIARCAVHGVLFHGFSGENSHFEKPLAGSAATEAQNQEFFDNFFASQAQTYSNLLPSTRSVTKVDKKKYIVTQVVEVHKDQLRRFLQDAGIIRGLNSAF